LLSRRSLYVETAARFALAVRTLLETLRRNRSSSQLGKEEDQAEQE
jgi:hypothetical protein